MHACCLDKKKKRKGPDEEPTPPPPAVALYSDAAGTAAVPADTDNARAWVTGGVLVIDTHRFQVEVNPPTASALTLPLRPMLDFPLLPVPDLQYAHVEDCMWTWQRCTGAGVAGGEGAGPVLSRERAYTPGEDDVGMRLLVTCVPGRAGTDVMHSGEPLATMTGVLLLPLLCIDRSQSGLRTCVHA